MLRAFFIGYINFDRMEISQSDSRTNGKPCKIGEMFHPVKHYARVLPLIEIEGLRALRQGSSLS